MSNHCTQIFPFKRASIRAFQPWKIITRVIGLYFQLSNNFLTLYFTKVISLSTSNSICKKHGTAMGTKMAPPYTTIFMGDLENAFFDSNLIDKRPEVWLRFQDDIFLILFHGPELFETKIYKNICSHKIYQQQCRGGLIPTGNKSQEALETLCIIEHIFNIHIITHFPSTQLLIWF